MLTGVLLFEFKVLSFLSSFSEEETVGATWFSLPLAKPARPPRPLPPEEEPEKLSESPGAILSAAERERGLDPIGAILSVVEPGRGLDPLGDFLSVAEPGRGLDPLGDFLSVAEPG